MRAAVLLVPVSVSAPPMFVFIPPPMIRGIATFTSFPQFVSRMFRLLAIPPMMFNGLVEAVVGFGDAMLAFGLVCAHV